MIEPRLVLITPYVSAPAGAGAAEAGHAVTDDQRSSEGGNASVHVPRRLPFGYVGHLCRMSRAPSADKGRAVRTAHKNAMKVQANGLTFNVRIDGPEGGRGSFSVTRSARISTCGTRR